MRLSHSDYHFIISLSEGVFPVLVIERSDAFRECVCEIQRQVSNQDGKFTLSHNWEPVSISKNILMVTDLLSIDFTDRKMMTTIINRMHLIASSEHMVTETHRLCNDFSTWLLHIEEEMDVPITHDYPVSIVNLIKSSGIRFDIETSSIIEKIDCLVKVCTELLKIPILLFVGLHCYTTKDELATIYKMAMLRKIRIIDIERYYPECKDRNEVIYLIDKDLCEIY